jgi:hypothetical protein
MAKRKTKNNERGAIALNSTIEPGTLHMVFVVCGVALSGVVILAVAFAASRPQG